MGCNWRLSRRTLLRSWIAALLGKTVTAATASGFDPVSFTLRGFAPNAVFQRRYRLDATILLFGAPIFTRSAAGGGYASVEISSGTGSYAMALQFAAGSDPARAHGLNRFGILQEAVLKSEDGSTDGELSFAGLMTRAREESFEQGRKALTSSARGAEGVLARGRMTGQMIRSWIEPVDLPVDRNWTNLTETLSDALRRDPVAPPRETATNSTTTFLCAMRAAALSQAPIVRRDFTHAGKPYRLETRRHRERPFELAGAIRNAAGARTAEFRTAYAPGDESGVPIRIDYRPRSFLRLTFEAALEANQPPVPSVFHQESA
ncbi:MAG TPA: hypothetical protein VME17_17620 [Bryobacteraceae bacterium]|nr:hypothetical protein [Bryobacteraceae bacterium]